VTPAERAGIRDGIKLAALRDDVKLQPHQQEAREKAHGNTGVLLNHGLGSGKTLSSMAIAEDRGGNVLAVVPASLRENYKKQMAQFVTDDRHGSYHVMSYEKFRGDPEGHVARIKPNTLVADEVHRLRNAGFSRDAFRSVRDKVPHMVGLTGSLINNHPVEMANLANLVSGKPLYESGEEFKRTHLGTEKVKPGLWGRIRGVEDGMREKMVNPKELKRRLSPHVHHFSGSPEYKKHMPRVHEESVRVEMSPHQEALYNHILRTNPQLAYKIKKNLPPSKRELSSMNSFMTAARQVSNNPAAYDKTLQGDPIRHSPKMKRMVDDVHAKAKGNENFRAITYSSFLESGVQPQVREHQRRGMPAAAFTGRLTDKKRKAMVEDMNQGRVKVLGLSPAGGEGLDLKGVRMVQLTEEHWNPERGAQAIGRATRYKSHDHLPEHERDVMVKRYFATQKPGILQRMKLKKRPVSADEYINQRRLEKHRLNKEFVDAIS
jgi:SNF2 family DNA or RNA helicase